MPNVRLMLAMPLAIEPILNGVSKQTHILKDQWTTVMVDRSLSAQFEHTVPAKLDVRF